METGNNRYITGLKKKLLVVVVFAMSLVGAVGVFWYSTTAASDFQNLIEDTRSPIGLDLYKHTYETTEDLIQKRALTRTLEDLDTGDPKDRYSAEDLKNILANDPARVIEKGNTTRPDLRQELFDRIRTTYQFERDLADYELALQIETGALGQYSNGTTDDSDFDLVVDLNTIDVIFFGEKARVPIARWGSYDGFLLDLDGSNPHNGNANNSNTNGGVNNANQNTSLNQNTNAFQSNANGQNQNSSSFGNSNVNRNPSLNTNSNASNTNTNAAIAQCLPASAVTIQDIRNDLDGLRDKVADIRNQIEEGGDVALGDVNTESSDTPLLPLQDRDYPQVPKSPSDSSPGSSQEISDADKNDQENTSIWPCNQFFCIRISMRNGVSNTTYPTYDNSIKAHLDYIYKFINETNRYPLALKKNTKEFFGLGFYLMQLAQHVDMKVIVTSKPVWSPKQHTYSALNSQKIREAEQASRGKADPGQDTLQNGVTTASAKSEFSNILTDATQSELIERLRSYEAEVADSSKALSETARLSARLNAVQDQTALVNEALLFLKTLNSSTDIFAQIRRVACSFATEVRAVGSGGSAVSGGSSTLSSVCR